MAKSEIKRPIGYEDCIEERVSSCCTAEIQKGRDEKEPLQNGAVVTIHPMLAAIAKAVRDKKEMKKPISEEFAIIKAQPTRSRGTGRED